MESVKTGWIGEAFGAWLVLAHTAGDKRNFGAFINAIGLGEKKPELQPEQRAAMIENSNAIAERILKMHGKKRNGKKNI